MIKNFTLKQKWPGKTIAFAVTLIFSLTAVQSMGQETWEFDFTGDYQLFEVPYSGPYLLEAWGAAGGDGNWSNVEHPGGKGGFVKGEVDLEQGDILYIYVGEKPSRVVNGAAGGGGATDFRYDNGNGTWMNSAGLNSR